MLLESLIIGGIALNAVVALAPSILDLSPPRGLAERITDSRNFTINVVSVGPEVTVVDLVAPPELDPGIMPTVNITVRHNRTRFEYIFARIIDTDTGQVVCPMKRQYVNEAKDFTFNFQGLGPAGDWTGVMPDRAWNLLMEVGLWWL